MKIGIITLQLDTNYGGILQAYALQTVLRNLGHDPIILNRKWRVYSHRLLNFIVYWRHRLDSRKEWIPSNRDYDIVEMHTRKFIKCYIKRSKRLYSTKALRRYVRWHKVDACIVGSDQVWRYLYSGPVIGNYYLDFTHDLPIKRMAYAASFGIDEWDYPNKDEQLCASLAKKFDAVSVRERSGVETCREHLGVDAIHLIDPTLLLPRTTYENLVVKANVPLSEGDMFCYILDHNLEIDTLTKSISQTLGLKAFYVEPNAVMEKNNNNSPRAKDCIVPPVECWLRAFMDAKLVITDSFHGCVFSIIFNKPFWVVGNIKRGMARFNSLLELFGLQNRMISINNTKSIDFMQSIDWENVNVRKVEMVSEALRFLINNLQ